MAFINVADDFTPGSEVPPEHISCRRRKIHSGKPVQMVVQLLMNMSFDQCRIKQIDPHPPSNVPARHASPALPQGCLR